jgi:hypothetical protein
MHRSRRGSSAACVPTSTPKACSASGCSTPPFHRSPVQSESNSWVQSTVASHNSLSYHSRCVGSGRFPSFGSHAQQDPFYGKVLSVRFACPWWWWLAFSASVASAVALAMTSRVALWACLGAACAFSSPSIATHPIPGMYGAAEESETYTLSVETVPSGHEHTLHAGTTLGVRVSEWEPAFGSTDLVVGTIR